MSDTPRTDTARPPFIELQGFVSCDFARDLERELAVANERIRRLEAALQAEVQAKEHAERELEQAKEDRARAAMDARNPLLERLAALEAENKAMRDRVAELDTERQGAQSAIRRAYEAASAAIEMRAAGNALARHVAEETRGQTARKLVQAWEEAAR